MSRKASVSADRAPSPSKAKRQDRRPHLLAEAAALKRPAQPRPGVDRPVDREVASRGWTGVPIGCPSSVDRAGGAPSRPAAQLRPGLPVVRQEAALERRARARSTRRPRTASRRVGGCRPCATSIEREQLVVGRQAQDQPLAADPQAEERPGGLERRAPRGSSVRRGRRRPWAPDGTLRPWVLSRRWKSSSRS